MEQRSSAQSLCQIPGNVNVLMHGNYLRKTMQMGVLRYKAFTLINHIVPVSHSDSFRININIAAMHIITARILYVSNDFQNTNFPFHEIFCVSPPPDYLNWFEKSYPDVPLDRDDGPFFFHA